MKLKTIITAWMVMMLIAATSLATESENKNLTRIFDPVIVTGDQTDLDGAPIANYNLYAIDENQLKPIPFQIDERDEDGFFVLTAGKEASTDKDNGYFDENDELVFMAKDTGDRLTDHSILPASYRAMAELEIKDPLTRESGWAYLLAFDSPAQDKSTTDYVNYTPQTRMLETTYYMVGFDPAYPATPADYAFKKTLGGTGEDFLDRAKIRVMMGALGCTLHRNENDIKVKALGYIDGPVRVVSYVHTKTPLVLGIPASSTRQYTYYYQSIADFGFAASFPLKPSKFRVTIIDDFKNAIGWTVYNSNNPEGIVIDGKMGPADKNLNLSPWTWGVISNGTNSFWSRWQALDGCPARASLYFNDDMNAEDKYENDPGERPGIGFDFIEGWDELEEDRIELRLIHFFTKGYTSELIPEVIQVHDVPLEVSGDDITGDL
ncbi:MAG: hypothetical protein SWH61_06325 [Thermodesulfobacteriota bacterium]|nr:hypothetical protein [Thermodesulfobacteriota bacterium]